MAQCSIGVDAAEFGGKCTNEIRRGGGGGGDGGVGERLTEFCSDGGRAGGRLDSALRDFLSFSGSLWEPFLLR